MRTDESWNYRGYTLFRDRRKKMLLYLLFALASFDRPIPPRDIRPFSGGKEETGTHSPGGGRANERARNLYHFPLNKESALIASL